MMRATKIVAWTFIFLGLGGVLWFFFAPQFIMSFVTSSYADQISNDFLLDKKVAGLFGAFIGIFYYFFVFKPAFSLNLAKIERSAVVSVLFAASYPFTQYFYAKEFYIQGKCQVYNPEFDEDEICDCEIPGAMKDANTGFYIHILSMAQL